mmetsp:Transcript_7592/g.12783  ORF Transcript_7592/g.12783 Transcript_7592/m.12783 type:complete len:247 (+) Transcript_7592:569-1309(+)
MPEIVIAVRCTFTRALQRQNIGLKGKSFCPVCRVTTADLVTRLKYSADLPLSRSQTRARCIFSSKRDHSRKPNQRYLAARAPLPPRSLPRGNPWCSMRRSGGVSSRSCSPIKVISSAMLVDDLKLMEILTVQILIPLRLRFTTRSMVTRTGLAMAATFPSRCLTTPLPWVCPAMRMTESGQTTVTLTRALISVIIPVRTTLGPGALGTLAGAWYIQQMKTVALAILPTIAHNQLELLSHLMLGHYI